MDYTSDEDEVPVIVLNESAAERLENSTAAADAVAAAATALADSERPRRRRKKRSPTGVKRVLAHHRSSRQPSMAAVEFEELHQVNTPPNSSSNSSQNDHQHPSANQAVPPLFSFAGNLFGKARSVFNPPPSSSKTPPPSPGSDHTHIPHQHHHTNPTRQQHHHRSATAHMPIGAGGLYTHGNSSWPTLTPGMPEHETFFNDYDHIGIERLESAQHHSDMFEPAPKKKKHSKKKPKTLGTMLRSINPAVYVATVSVGFLIVHQQELIKQYMSEVVAVMINCVNALTIAFTALGGIVVSWKLFTTIGRSYGLIGGAAAAPAAKANEPQGVRFSASPGFDDAMDRHYADDLGFRTKYAMDDGMMPPQRASMYGPTTAEEFMMRNGRFEHDDGFGNPVSYMGRQPPQQFDEFHMNHMFPHHHQGGRSYSQPAIPAILNPTPLYGGMAGVGGPAVPGVAGRGGLQFEAPRPSPMTAPLSRGEHYNSSGSYFPTPIEPQMPLGLGTEPPYATPAGGAAVSPSPVDMSQPMAFPSAFGGSREDSGSPPLPAFSAKNKHSKAFISPKKVVFQRQEASVVGEDEDSEPPYAVDSFSCKPYGPPPKRYHGVNV
ncbi:hypothetical protein TRVA0_008S00804 [Trichomonascus vanleenenianus]|uniref:uncharacterized protein n=1 Tax=Trichomonascus vanleenenianus TaxID=2268995 RepID=UPI003ECACAE6